MGMNQSKAVATFVGTLGPMFMRGKLQREAAGNVKDEAGELGSVGLIIRYFTTRR